MPPRKRGRGGTAQTVATPSRDDDAMDLDTPQASETPTAGATAEAATDAFPGDGTSVLDSCWTSEQKAGLFSAVIRWKPSGMHRHFRMIAISEHLRCRGFDPDEYQHTRIPGIWKELATEYALEAINDRDNALDYVDDAEVPSRFKEFSLPLPEFRTRMLERALADDTGSNATSPGQWNPDEPDSPLLSSTAETTAKHTGAAAAAARSANPRKRKRGGGEGRATHRTRSSTVDSASSAAAPLPVPAGRGRRGGRRGGAATRGRKPMRGRRTAEAEVDDSNDDNDDDDDDDEEEEGDGDDEQDDSDEEGSRDRSDTEDGSGEGEDGEDDEDDEGNEQEDQGTEQSDSDNGTDDELQKGGSEDGKAGKAVAAPATRGGRGRGRGGYRGGRPRGRGRGGRGRGRS